MTSVEKSLALGLILEIYRDHSAGCCWHIVLDDGNCEQGNVDFCRGVASKEQHTACMLLGGVLADKTRGEVRAIVDKAHRKMNQEEKEVAWERINDQRRDDKMTEDQLKEIEARANAATYARRRK